MIRIEENNLKKNPTKVGHNTLDLRHNRGLIGGSGVKNLPPNAGDAGSIPGWEDPLQKEMSTHSSILAWEISWTEEPGRLQSMGSQKSDTN